MKIKHIGIINALCNKKIHANLRADLGKERYEGLGVTERFKGEKPYRICKNCIKELDYRRLRTRKAYQKYKRNNPS